MKTYDYMHQGMTDGNAAVPGKMYTVLRTKQKLKGKVDGWMATKNTTATKRMFVREGGDFVYFGDDDMLR